MADNGNQHHLMGRNAQQLAQALIVLCYGDKRLAVRELFHTARVHPQLSTAFLLAVLEAIEMEGTNG
jgi:hypothetical protein